MQKKAQSVGMVVPEVVAFDYEYVDQRSFLWIVERYVEGREFYLDQADAKTRETVLQDMGRRLSLLHKIEVSGFGSLSDCIDIAKFSTWDEWIEDQEDNIGPARNIVGTGSASTPQVRAVYRRLKQAYKGPASLCHGDFSGDNLLVDNGRLVAVIDWENAIACDPAYDVAYWYRWHGDLNWLDSLLAGYEPESPTDFRERVILHAVLQAVGFIVWYSEERQDKEATAHSLKTLEENLSRLSR